MHQQRTDQKTRHAFSGVLTATLLLFAAQTCLLRGGTITNLGQPYVPPGATNYNITAMQNIASDGTGGTSVGAQVNAGFEIDQAFGVTYTNSNNSITQSGIGMYKDAGNNTIYSTGLMVNYLSPIVASTANVYLTDFDLAGGKTPTAFLAKDVEPNIVFYNADGSVLTAANPTQIFPFITSVANPDPAGYTAHGDDDWYTLDTGGLLASLGQSSSANIGGILFYADGANGESIPGDPYELYSVGDGTSVVPEPGSALLFVIAAVSTRLRRRRPAN